MPLQSNIDPGRAVDPRVLSLLQKLLGKDASGGIGNALAGLSLMPLGGVSEFDILPEGATTGKSDADLIKEFLAKQKEAPPLVQEQASAPVEQLAKKAPRIRGKTPAAPELLQGGQKTTGDVFREAAANMEAAETSGQPLNILGSRGDLPPQLAQAEQVKDKLASIQTIHDYLRKLKLLSGKAQYALEKAEGAARQGYFTEADRIIKEDLDLATLLKGKK